MSSSVIPCILFAFAFFDIYSDDFSISEIWLHSFKYLLCISLLMYTFYYYSFLLKDIGSIECCNSVLLSLCISLCILCLFLYDKFYNMELPRHRVENLNF